MNLKIHFDWFFRALVLLFILMAETQLSGAPVALWRFDEPAGNVAVDMSGNGLNVSLLGAPEWTSGQKVHGHSRCKKIKPMIFLIKPGEGVGPVEFGMSPEEARYALGEGWVSFKRTPVSEYPCDYFESLGVFVYYTASAQVEAVEFTDSAEVMYEGVNLLQMPFDKLKDLLQKKERGLEVEVDGITAYDLGIGVYAPLAAEEPATKSTSIIVFEKGYYGK